jgi:hypothetical protein
VGGFFEHFFHKRRENSCLSELLRYVLFYRFSWLLAILMTVNLSELNIAVLRSTKMLRVVSQSAYFAYSLVHYKVSKQFQTACCRMRPVDVCEFHGKKNVTRVAYIKLSPGIFLERLRKTTRNNRIPLLLFNLEHYTF